MSGLVDLQKARVSLPKELLVRKPVKCDACGKRMRIVFTRDDGCRYYECRNCGATMGEETQEWFAKMGLK